jgi:hypothetical protein
MKRGEVVSMKRAIILFLPFLPLFYAGCADRGVENPDGALPDSGFTDAGGKGGFLKISSSAPKFQNDVEIGCLGRERIRVTLQNTGDGDLRIDAIESIPLQVFRITQFSVPPSLKPAGTGYIELGLSPEYEGFVLGEVQVRSDAVNAHNGYLSEFVGGNGILKTPVKDVFDSPPLQKADFLICMDGTGAMIEKQYDQARNLLKILTDIQESNLDFNIGIVTSDYDAERECSGLIETTPGVLIHREGVPRIVAGYPPADPPPAYEPFINDPHAALASNLSFGICNPTGKGGCLEAVKKALTEPNITSEGANLGFRREGARLSVWILTNSDDHSPGLIPDYASFMARNVNGLALIAPLDLDNVSAPVPKACKGDPVSEAPNRYADLCKETGCSFLTICDRDWYPGQARPQFITFPVKPPIEFYLSRLPDQTTIDARLDGKQLPRDNPWGWTYNAGENMVTMGSEFVFPHDSRVEITYKPACPDGG